MKIKQSSKKKIKNAKMKYSIKIKYLIYIKFNR